MGTGTVDEVDTQEEEEHNRKFDELEFRLSLKNSTHEKEVSTNKETVWCGQNHKQDY